MKRARLMCWVVMMAVVGAASQAQETEYTFEPIADGLYRYTAGAYHSVVWVGEDGILIVDPLNEAAATWLKAHLVERFEQPIRYVVYSHNHFDHAYGGEVYDEPGVVFVSHAMARQDMAHSEAQTRLADVTFNDQMTIRMGDESLVMRYHGPNNGYGSVSMHFEAQRVMFVVDWIVVGRVPYRDFKGYDIEGMIHSTKEVLALDWDTFVGGHADLGDRSAVQRYLDYLESLYAAVRDGMRAGKSLEMLQTEIDLSDYQDLKMYDQWKADNIAGVYRLLADRSYMLMRPEVPEP